MLIDPRAPTATCPMCDTCFHDMLFDAGRLSLPQGAPFRCCSAHLPVPACQSEATRAGCGHPQTACTWVGAGTEGKKLVAGLIMNLSDHEAADPAERMLLHGHVRTVPSQEASSAERFGPLLWKSAPCTAARSSSQGHDTGSHVRAFQLVKTDTWRLYYAAVVRTVFDP